MVDPKAYNYLDADEDEDFLIPDIDDKEDFKLTQECMDDLGFTAEEKDDIFYIISGILLLGNIDFIDSDEGTDSSLVDEKCKLNIFLTNIFV